jgi:glycosyltransferase involved in cell wall biosynthesis
VLHGAGVLIHPDADEWDLVRTIDELLADAELRAKLSAGGQERARDRYAWPVVARAHLSFFKELLSQ